MKTLLISCFLTLAASLAYAGGSCCVKSGDSKDKDAGESDVAESPITLACGCSGDKGDKKGEKFSIRDTLLA